VDRATVCVWPEKFTKPKPDDTLEQLFTDESVSVENAIIRLWPLIRDKKIIIANIRITSLNSIKALCEWIVPESGYINALDFKNVIFSPDCWLYMINALNDTRSIRSFCYSNVTARQLQDLSNHCREFFSLITELDFSGEGVESEAFIPPLVGLLHPKLRRLNLAGRNLGNGFIVALSRIPSAKIDLTRNGITDISALTDFPENIDLRHNSIPAAHLLSFLKGLLEKRGCSILFDKSPHFLPQNLEYSPGDISEIERVLSQVYIPIRRYIMEEEMIFFENILPERLIKKFTIYKKLDRENIWDFFAGLFKAEKKKVAEVIFVNTRSDLSNWKKVEANPGAYVQEMLPILACAFDKKIVVHHADGITETLNGDKGKETFDIYKDMRGVYYALQKGV
jgi:hypothetical protein